MNPFYVSRQKQIHGLPGWSLKLVTGPTSEPVTIDDIDAQQRIDGDDENAYIEDLITVAREQIETITGRCCFSQSWKQFFDRFPCRTDDFLELRRGPLIAVASVKYTNSAGVVTTMTAGTDYVVDSNRDPARIVLPYAGTWPTATLSTASPVEVAFSVGYDANTIPARYRHAIRLLVAHWFQNREPVLSGSGVAAIELPHTVDALIEPLRYRYFGD